jgi:hypothetical protein
MIGGETAIRSGLVPPLAEYHATQMSVQIPGVIPAKAGIQVVFLDSGQNHAGMTDLTMETSLCGAVLNLRLCRETFRGSSYATVIYEPRHGEPGATPSPSAQLPPLQGEGRGGHGCKRGRDTAIAPHPPPNLPLEGGGATVLWVPLRRLPDKPPALPVVFDALKLLLPHGSFLRSIEAPA